MMVDELRYDKLFDPQEVDVDEHSDAEPSDESVYVFDEEVVLAVNVALATARPLLVYGPPGCGKSSLAPNIARILAAPYYSEVITSRTEGRDLLWRFDAVRRLSDAQVNEIRQESEYLSPGVLWKAFDRTTAEQTSGEGLEEPASAAGVASAVVLLDEIDKADPDVPNSLLAPLGTLQFRVTDNTIVRATGSPPLIVITSNNERELSRPFLRRCIILTLKTPSPQHLVKVAEARMSAAHRSLYEHIAELVAEIAKAADETAAVPSTAEFLDAVRSCIRLGIQPGGPEWTLLRSAVLAKPVST